MGHTVLPRLAPKALPLYGSRGGNTMHGCGRRIGTWTVGALVGCVIALPGTASANTAPSCPDVPVGYLSVAENGNLPLQGSCNDPDPGDTLTYHADPQSAAGGQVAPTGP